MNDGYVTRREFVGGCAGAAAALAAAGTGLADDAATVALAGAWMGDTLLRFTRALWQAMPALVP